MQTHQAASPALMMRFAKQQQGAPRCARCGQRFHLSFSGGRLVEQRCTCGLVYRIAGAEANFIGENDANDAEARNAEEFHV
jgi:hypothetical protein